MRPAAIALPILALALLVLPACDMRSQPAPVAPPPAPVKPVTGWTGSDSSTIGAEIADALTNDAWVNRFHESSGRAPVVEVDDFDDRSGDHVPVAELTATIRKAIGNGDRVLSVGEGQIADVRLSGVVGLRAGEIDGHAAQFFTVDARVIDAHTNESLWVTGLQSQRQEPAAVIAPAGPVTPAAGT